MSSPLVALSPFQRAFLSVVVVVVFVPFFVFAALALWCVIFWSICLGGFKRSGAWRLIAAGAGTYAGAKLVVGAWGQKPCSEMNSRSCICSSKRYQVAYTHKHTHCQTIVIMLRPRSMNCGALLIRCVGQILGQRTHTGRQAKERQSEREQQWKYPQCIRSTTSQTSKSHGTKQRTQPRCPKLCLLFVEYHLPASARLFSADRSCFFVFLQITAIFERCLIGNSTRIQKNSC